ncbi:MAG: class I SAM-dependent methyltransferase [candidate division Zixibacteria bacterium]
MTDFTDIAPFYDKMTGYADRLIGDFGTIKHLVKKFNFKNALDAGCGTGVHSIILSKIGVDTIGLDSSEQMLEMARANALKEGVEIQFEKEFFESMPNEWTDKFDSVFCLANSLVGVETGERLSLAMKSFNRVLCPGGTAILQLVNFIKYRKENKRIIKVSSDENLTFVRFFDFEKEVTRLNVLVIEYDMGQVKHKFISQPILPINTEVIAVAAKIGGFSSIEFFSDLSLTDPFSNDADNMIVVLTK